MDVLIIDLLFCEAQTNWWRRARVTRRVSNYEHNLLKTLRHNSALLYCFNYAAELQRVLICSEFVVYGMKHKKAKGEVENEITNKKNILHTFSRPLYFEVWPEKSVIMSTFASFS